MICARINIGTELGDIPEKESLKDLANVTVGFAKTNEEVIKKAEVIQSGMAIGAKRVCSLRLRN